MTPLTAGFGFLRIFDPADQVETLRAALDAAPKSARWRLRARVGDRVPWYNEPEEVGHAL